MNRPLIGLVAVLTIAACVDPTTAPTRTDVLSLATRPTTGIIPVDLGSPTSSLGSADAGSVARAVNRFGVAAGYAATRKYEPGSFTHAMRWTINANGTVQMDNLMPALGLPANTDAVALGINDAGVIVGDFTATDGAPYHGFVLEPSGVIDVNDLSLCSGEQLQGNTSTTRDINNRGEVVGWRVTSETESVAFVLSVADRCLVALPSLGLWAMPTAINDNSVIAGTSDTPFGERGVRWTRSLAGEWTIQVIGNESVQVWGISAAGDVAGTLIIPNPGHVYDQAAFAWLGASSTPTTLATLGGQQSGAYDISETGRIVGWSHNKQLYMRPFLWTPAGIRDLGTLGGPRGSADAISGEWIAGNSELFTKGREITGHATMWRVP